MFAAWRRENSHISYTIRSFGRQMGCVRTAAVCIGIQPSTWTLGTSPNEKWRRVESQFRHLSTHKNARLNTRKLSAVRFFSDEFEGPALKRHLPIRLVIWSLLARLMYHIFVFLLGMAQTLRNWHFRRPYESETCHLYVLHGRSFVFDTRNAWKSIERLIWIWAEVRWPTIRECKTTVLSGACSRLKLKCIFAA